MQQFCAYFSLFEMKYFRFAAKCLSKSIKKKAALYDNALISRKGEF